MGIVSALAIAGFVFGNSYLLFQGQMRNIGAIRALIALTLAPFPLSLLFIFGSKVSDPKCEAMIKAFHKNFARNILLQPFRLLTSAAGGVFSIISGRQGDFFKNSYGRLYEDAVDMMEKEQKEKEEQVRQKVESQSETPTEVESRSESESEGRAEVASLQQERDALRAELAMLNDNIFQDCRKVGELYELKGIELPDGTRYVVAPSERLGTVQLAAKKLDPDVEVLSRGSMEDFKARLRDEMVGYVPRQEFDVVRSSSNGEFYVGVDSRFTEDQRKRLELSFSSLGKKVTVLSHESLDSMKAELPGSFVPAELDALTVERSPFKEFTYLYDAVRKDVTTPAAFYGVPRSGNLFEKAMEKVSRVISSQVSDASERKSWYSLRHGDQIVFNRGFFLMKTENSFKLCFADGKDGVPHDVGEVKFLPERGDGQEFEVNISNLKALLYGDSYYSPEDARYARECFESAFGEKFGSGEEVVTRLESLRGPDIADVWCDTVKCEQNREVLAEQSTIEGFKAMEYMFKEQEAMEQVKKQELVEKREVTEKVSVVPRI